MTRSEFYLLIILSLVLCAVSAIKHRKPKLRKHASHNIGPISKTDIPTAEQILGKLLGLAKSKPPDQQTYATPPQTLPQYPPGSTPQARSPYKIFGSTGATPQTEDNPGPGGYPLPPPPPGYHYGRPRRKRPPSEDEYESDEGGEEQEEEEQEEGEQDDQPLEEDPYKDVRIAGHRRGRGRCRHLGRNLEHHCHGCKCICWKGIKPHIQWVRVPVCYRPCGVCCPKHEEQGACAAICHPCCHCCHCCCHHPCHCCHCCHCCRRSIAYRPPLAPLKVKKLKNKKQTKKNKLKNSKSKTKISKRKP